MIDCLCKEFSEIQCFQASLKVWDSWAHHPKTLIPFPREEEEKEDLGQELIDSYTREEKK